MTNPGAAFSTPIFAPVGPYVYTETDVFADPQYGESVTATFTQTTQFQSDPTGSIDTPMWQLNQGMLQYWYKLNNKPDWQTYIQILYYMVNEGLGVFTQNYMVQTLLNQNYLSIPDDINANFLPMNPIVSQDAINFLYNRGSNP